MGEGGRRGVVVNAGVDGRKSDSCITVFVSKVTCMRGGDSDRGLWGSSQVVGGGTACVWARGCAVEFEGVNEGSSGEDCEIALLFERCRRFLKVEEVGSDADLFSFPFLRDPAECDKSRCCKRDSGGASVSLFALL